jgi:hypothetical protein
VAVALVLFLPLPLMAMSLRLVVFDLTVSCHCVGDLPNMLQGSHELQQNQNISRHYNNHISRLGKMGLEYGSDRQMDGWISQWQLPVASCQWSPVAPIRGCGGGADNTPRTCRFVWAFSVSFVSFPCLPVTFQIRRYNAAHVSADRLCGPNGDATDAVDVGAWCFSDARRLVGLDGSS